MRTSYQSSLPSGTTLPVMVSLAGALSSTSETITAPMQVLLVGVWVISGLHSQPLSGLPSTS